MDITAADFEEKVIRESHNRPVLVDFWAPWCGPCKTLTPALEALEVEYAGKFALAKVNTDAEQELGQTFQIRSIPDVKIFKDGKVVGGFVGAQPPAAIRAILDELLPSEELTTIVALALTDPASALAKLTASRLSGKRRDEAAWAIVQGELQQRSPAMTTVRAAVNEIPEFGSPFSEKRGGLIACSDAGLAADILRSLVMAEGDTATKHLASLIEKIEGTKNHAAEKDLMIAAFHVLGNDHPLTIDFRRKLSRALY